MRAIVENAMGTVSSWYLWEARDNRRPRWSCAASYYGDAYTLVGSMMSPRGMLVDLAVAGAEGEGVENVNAA